MHYYIDVAYDSLNKHGEELCGDKVEVIRVEDGVIVVLADGLGSGVKANILATLTCKIAGTMLKEGISITETVDTIVHTLPVCSVRQLAYCTFTIIKIFNDGTVSTIEYDNPPIFFIKEGEGLYTLNKKELHINDKILRESSFCMSVNDSITIVSDGAIHAGIGATLNLGWQWKHVAEYLKNMAPKEKCAANISKNLIHTCNDLYNNKPGDDTTSITIKLRQPEMVTIFTGPPKESGNDSSVIAKLVESSGKKVICGGTASNIAARELNRKMKVSIEYIDSTVPPTAMIEGIDLVTEGVLTLSKATEKIRNYLDESVQDKAIINLKARDGASQLANLLIEDCTHLNLLVGKAVNPAHQNPSFPSDLSIKLKVVDELVAIMGKLGKEVKVDFV